MKPFSFFDDEFLKKSIFNNPLKKGGGRPGIGVLRNIPSVDEPLEAAPESEPHKVEYYSELSYEGEKVVPVKNFFLKVVGKTEYRTFSKDYTWGVYGVHAEFRQRIEKGAVDVQVQKTIMKAWQGFMVNMTKAGVTGTAVGCPYEKRRWGRIIGSGDIPNQYHDGKKWLPMPNGFIPEWNMFSAYGFIDSGGKFMLGDEPTAFWPDKFTDYDFDCAKFAKKRKAWIKDTDSRWSRKFLVRPKTCKKGSASGGCGYPLDLQLELKKVDAWQNHTIAVCNGEFRSNAGCFSLEDEDIAMVAHEVGHLVGLTDEYEGGGVDPTINGDGAVQGLDPNSLMGDAMDKVKKRHYVNFVGIVESQVTAMVGKKIEFSAAEK